MRMGNHSNMQTPWEAKGLTQGMYFWLDAPWEAYLDRSFSKEIVPRYISRLCYE